jgi:hypothetical protein
VFYRYSKHPSPVVQSLAFEEASGLAFLLRGKAVFSSRRSYAHPASL